MIFAAWAALPFGISVIKFITGLKPHQGKNRIKALNAQFLHSWRMIICVHLELTYG
jgi:hypothetical protein